MQHYKAIIIGSGQGGTPLSKKLAKEGWKTALIEKNNVGGTCINVGCTPTKTMVASARAMYDVSTAGKYGVKIKGYDFDMDTVLKRKNEVVEKFRSGSQKGLEETENLDLYFGTASFVDEKKISVILNSGETIVLTADYIFIDVGGRPTIPDIEGLEETGYLTSTSIMELHEVPEHLLIIGGGYVGLEFGQMYCRFGSKVTILENSDRFLSREDEDIAEVIADFLKEEAIEIITGTEVTKVSKNEHGIQIQLTINEKERTIQCSHILVSSGRTPNTDTLNLEAAGITKNDKGYINVNDKLETNIKNIYALGDVKGGPAFTHISYNDYIVLFDNLIEGKSESIKNRMVPYTMFTDPQLGRIGLSEQEAREKGLNFKVAKLPMSSVARAIETGDTRGVMKAVIDTETGSILGAAIVGRAGGEVMSVIQMAMAGGIDYYTLKDMIFAHPLYTESLNNLFMSIGD